MAKSQDNKSEMTFNTKQMSDMLGVTARRVQQLADEGVMIKSGRGKYIVVESVKNYLRFLQKRDSGQMEVDYFQERALHERAKREKADLELAVIKNELHHAEDIRVVMSDMLVAFRSKILSMPSKLAPQLVGRTEIPVIMEAITKEAYEALSELAEYNPADFQASQATADEKEQ